MRRPLLILVLSMMLAVSTSFAQEFQDTIRYVQVKEQLLGTNTYATITTWQTDGEAVSQTFLHTGASLIIKGVEFYGSRDNTSGGAATLTVRAAVYAVNANNTPTTLLTSGTVTLTATTNTYHYVNFATPVTVTTNYAIVLEAINANGILKLYFSNVDASRPYHETLARFKSNYYVRSAGNFVTIPTLTSNTTDFPGGPYNFEALIAPIVAYTPSVTATVPNSPICFQDSVAVTGAGSPAGLLNNRMYSYRAFRQHFGLPPDGEHEGWDMGDGNPEVLKASHKYRYAAPGTYEATYIFNGGFWASFSRSIQKTITVYRNPAPAIATQPVAASAFVNDPATFTIAAPTATKFQWQLNTGAGFVNINNANGWSGATTTSLSLSNYSVALNGALVRCQVVGECSDTLNSDAVSLTTSTKQPQLITFAPTRAAAYGDADFAPGASSTSSQSISYSSSNANVATIENGQVRIKSVGTTTITASLPGDDAYLPASEEQLLTVSARSITLTLQATPVIAKVYDGTTTASLTAANYNLQGVLPGDQVNVTGTATYGDAAASTSSTITAQSFVLSGTHKANYQLTTSSATVSGQITQKDITLLLNASPAISKVYDGTTTASLAAANYNLQGVLPGDQVNVTGTATYGDAAASTSSTITAQSFVLSGTHKANYQLTTSSATVSGQITQKDITLSLNASPAISKVYDGNTAATLTAANYNLQGVLPGDQVNVTGTATYGDAAASTSSTITAQSFVLSGTHKANYQLTTSSATVSGQITQKDITLSLNASPAISKVYDGSAVASLAEGNYNLQGLLSGDDVSLTYAATYADGAVGESKTVTVDQLSLTGAQKDNYSLTATASMMRGSITPKELSVTWKSGTIFSKVYDGSTAAALQPASFSLNGVVGDDVVDVAGSAAYDNAQSGDRTVSVASFTLGGRDANNYRMAAGAMLTASGTISPKALSVMADSHTKTYGADDPELTYKADGLIGNDRLSGALLRAPGKNTGSYTIGLGDLGGGSNYTIGSFEGASLTIVPATLRITAENRSKRQGEENPAFAFSYEGFVLGEGPAILTAKPQVTTTATRNSPMGNYPLVVSGAAAVNYTISMAPGTLTIIPAVNNLFKAWKSGPGLLQVRIYSEVARPARIRFAGINGQGIVVRQVQLSPGVNTYELAVGARASGIYLIQVSAGKDKEAATIFF